jgi:hypothetical protein
MAERRAFVANWRDGAADSREVVADARDAAADLREAELDAWERELELRAVELGLSGAPNPDLTDVAAARSQAAELRASLRTARQGIDLERNEASKRRLADGPPTLLALAFADIAEQLYGSRSFDEVLQRIAEVAVATVAGCSYASVTLTADDGYRTAASTHPVASAADQTQYRADEGPSLEAVTTALVSASSFPDERWPRLATHPIDAGVQSAVAYQLPASTGEGGGSLTTYGTAPGSFDDAAEQIGFILAAHASLAARAVGERGTLETLGVQLQEALFARDVIGQAKGILMERLRITPEDAFDILRTSSRELNVKLREVARKLTETGQV